MIKFENGDIFKANVEALVNPVNCVGIMGKGLALQFKKRFRDNFDLYHEYCARGQLRPGCIFVTTDADNENGQSVVNLSTKDHWMDKSEYHWIFDGLEDLVQWMIARDIKSIAIPAIGCGEGGLDWAKVKDMIVDCFEIYYKDEMKGVEVFVYEPRE